MPGDLRRDALRLHIIALGPVDEPERSFRRLQGLKPRTGRHRAGAGNLEGLPDPIWWALFVWRAAGRGRCDVRAGRYPAAPGEYRISGGKVDRGTYLGWRLYHTACFGCHGIDSTGTDLAPNLVDRVKLMSPRAFVTKVLKSYRIVAPSNDPNADDSVASREAMVDEVMRAQPDGRSRIVMPAWEPDSKVEPRVLDLFAYLTARADGKPGPGRRSTIIDPHSRAHQTERMRRPHVIALQELFPSADTLVQMPI